MRILSLLACLLMLGCGLPQQTNAQPMVPSPSAGVPQTGLRVEQLVIQTPDGDRQFDVEIAETPESREVGMMWRTSIGRTRGMLFLFEDNVERAFWMQNTLISLDLIYIRADGTIARINANAVPRSQALLPSGEPVVAVLEIGGGEALRQGLAEGQRVLHPFFGTAR
jgi:uncharacterized protein